jgi:alkylhydroperoxidase/carboxymuconolactone decarboxylase family protein YurZ
MANASYEKGMKTRRKVLGDDWVDQAEKNKTAFNADFQDLLTRYCWDEIWNRPGLTHKMRRTIVLSITLSLGRWEEFRLHARAGLESGDLSPDELKEILLQAAIYAGVPAANTAFREARDLVAAATQAKAAVAGSAATSKKRK